MFMMFWPVKHIMNILLCRGTAMFWATCHNKINMPSSWWRLLGSNPIKTTCLSSSDETHDNDSRLFIGEWTELYMLSLWKLQWGTVSFDGLVQYPETNASWFVNISAMFWDIWKKRLPWRKTRFLFDPKERHASTWGSPDRRGDTGLTRLLGDPHSGFLWKYPYLPTFSGSIAAMVYGIFTYIYQ